MGFYHVGQAGLELATSGDLPVSVSQNAGITMRREGPALPKGNFLKEPSEDAVDYFDK